MNLDWMFRELRPVGETISIGIDSRAPENELHRYFRDPMVFYQSGTAALAAALMACKSARRINRPEVLLPAYACPDLLSAVNYAGLRPVLVDFEENRPWMSITDLVSKVTAKTIAVIAVNFLGIPERLSEIRRIADERHIFLIEDRAQSLPENSEEAPSCDLVVLSFGKGKPVALLHGGALLIRRRELGQYVVRPAHDGSGGGFHAVGQYLKMAAYNLLIQPRCYWFLKYIPLLRLGETRYKSLTAIEPMKPACMTVLERNIRNYYERKNRASNIHGMLASFNRHEIINLPEVCGRNGKKMLRYPLLLPSETERNACLRLLKARGLGASMMYPGVLPVIKGVDLPYSAEDYPKAAAFAARLLTLPLHSDVTLDAVSEISTVFRQCLSAGY